MALDKEIDAALRAAFPQAVIHITNESHLHAGHSGDDGSGESHWHVSMRDNAIANLNRIARHRAVHNALGKDIMSRIHALALDLG